MEFRTIEKTIDYLADLILWVDRSGSIKAANECSAKLLEYSKEELRGLPIDRIYSELLPDELDKIWKRLISGEVIRISAEIRTKSGSLFPVDSILNQVVHNENECISITSRKIKSDLKYEEVLEESMVRYQALFENANDAIFLMDNQKFLQCNTKTLEIYGCKRMDEIVGHTPWEFSPQKQPDGSLSIAKAKEVIDKAMGGDPQRFYWKHNRLDGTLFDAEVSLNRLKIGEGFLIQAIVRDISTRVETTMALLESERRYSLASAAGRVGIWELDLLSGGMYIDPELKRLVGYEAEEIKDTLDGWLQHFDQSDRDFVKTSINEVMEGRSQPLYVEHRMIQKNGEIIWILTRGNIVRNSKGDPVKIIGTSTDISQLKQARTDVLESELRLRTILQTTAEAIFCYEYEPPIDTGAPIRQQVKQFYDGILVECNLMCAKSYGALSIEEVKGRSLLENFKVPPGSLDDFFKGFIDNGYRTSKAESTEPQKDGSVKYYLNNGHGVLENGKLLRVWGSFNDITEKKQAELALAESESKYRTIIQTSPDGITTSDLEGKIVYVSPQTLTLHGYDTEIEMEGIYALDLIHPSDRERAIQNLNRAQQGIPIKDVEYVFLKKDGSSFPGELTSSVIKDDSGNTIGFMAITKDISERKKAESELAKGRDLIARIMETSVGSIVFVDSTGQITLANEMAVEVLGLKSEDIESRTYKDPEWNITDFSGKPFPEEELPFSVVKRTGEPVYGIRHAMQWPDGNRRFLSINAAPIVNDLNEFDGMVAIMEDITDKIKAEAALRDSEERYRSVVSALSEGVILYDSDGNYVTANDAAHKILDVKRESLELRNIFDPNWNTIHEDGTQFKLEEYPVVQALRTGKGSSNRVLGVVKQNEDIVWITINTVPLINPVEGEMAGVVVSFSDITERKMANEAMIRERDVLQGLINGLPGIFYQYSEDKKLIRWNRQFSILGYQDSELKKLSLVDIVHPDYHKFAIDSFKKAFKGGIISIELVLVTKDNTEIPMIATGSGIKIDGKRYVVGTAIDISERKKVEQALLESEEKFSHAFKSSPDPLVISTFPERTIIEVNDSLVALSGYSREEVIGSSSDKLNLWVDDSYRDKFMKSMKRDRKISNMEIPFKNRHGEHFLMLLSSELIMFNNRPHLITILKDITKTRKAEEAIRVITLGTAGVTGSLFFDSLLQQLIRNLEVKYAFVGEWTGPEQKRVNTIAFSIDGEIVENFSYNLKKSPCEQVVGRHFCIYPEGVQKKFPDDTGLTKFGAESYAGIPLFDSSGSPLGLLVIMDNKAMKDPDNIESILQLFSIRASTELERLNTEKILLENEEKFRQLAENIEQTFFIATPDWKEILYINPIYEAFWGLPVESIIEKPKSWMDIIHPEDIDEVTDELDAKQKSAYSSPKLPEFRLIMEDGSIKWIQAKIYPILDEHGKVYRIAGIAEDITASKNIMEEISRYQVNLKSLVSEVNLAEERERRMLALNLHDNLGQSLAMAKIKLAAMKREENSAGLRVEIEEAESFISDAIRNSRDLTYELSPPVLYELGLVPALRWKLDQVKGKFEIRTRLVETNPIPNLPEDIQILMFRSVSELINNVLKHASAKNLQIKVGYKHGHLEAEVKDDGDGFLTTSLEIWDTAHKGFGLFSIRERVEYFSGKMVIDSKPGKGTRVSLEVPYNAKDNED